MDAPSSYRPISFLDGAEQLFEHILLGSLRAHINETSALSDRQFSFRLSRSTTDAISEVIHIAREAERGPVRKMQFCVVITLDVKIAFNLAPWKSIDISLQSTKIKILWSYTINRRLLIGGGTEAESTISVLCGVSQGSVLGPTL